MNIRTPQRAAAFGLATLLTLGVLASIDRLAVPPAPDSLLACAGPASQVGAGAGKRLASS